MTPWHSHMQALFPPSDTEVPFAAHDQDQRRSDTISRNSWQQWRCEFETQVPTLTRVVQRQAMCNRIVWVLNFCDPKYRRLLKPLSTNCPSVDDAGTAATGSAAYASHGGSCWQPPGCQWLSRLRHWLSVVTASGHESRTVGSLLPSV